MGAPRLLDLVSLDWAIDHMIPTVQRRGAAVIEARGASSAASAAGSVVDHVRDWFLGTPEDDWVSMSVHSDGSYGITEGLVYSFPVTCKNGDYQIVKGLEVTDFGKSRMKVTEKELLEERAVVAICSRRISGPGGAASKKPAPPGISRPESSCIGDPLDQAPPSMAGCHVLGILSLNLTAPRVGEKFLASYFDNP